MEENKNKLEKIDELLESTSSDKRIKFDINDVETFEGPKFNETDEEPAPANVDVVPVKENLEEKFEAAPEENTVELTEETVEEVAEAESEAPVSNGVQIIDETSTTFIFEEGPELTVSEISVDSQIKAPKEKIKFKPVHIVFMVIFGLIALWSIIFTVDHTLAANGISPVFCKQEAQYEDGSASYKGLGYKVQFKFDNNGNLTQKVCPAWQDGPNDIIHAEE